MKKSKEIIKGISECLYDSDREAYDWLYSEIIRVIRLLGGKECGTYRPDVYSMMLETCGFCFSHTVGFRKSVDDGNITGGISTYLDFGIGKDINGMTYILFDYLFTPNGEHFLVKETMHNQRCLSIMDVKFMRETEDGVFHFLTTVIDDIYRKQYGKSWKESFWDDAVLECKCVELPVDEWYYDSNGDHHTFKYELT